MVDYGSCPQTRGTACGSPEPRHGVGATGQAASAPKQRDLPKFAFGCTKLGSEQPANNKKPAPRATQCLSLTGTRHHTILKRQRLQLPTRIYKILLSQNGHARPHTRPRASVLLSPPSGQARKPRSPMPHVPACQCATCPHPRGTRTTLLLPQRRRAPDAPCRAASASNRPSNRQLTSLNCTKACLLTRQGQR